MNTAYVAGLGADELVIILLVVLLLFGAKKLPELARGSGRALRIFKAETQGLLEDDGSLKPTATDTVATATTASEVPAAVVTPELTPEQQEIATLKAQLAAERIKHPTAS